jgi:hypothetical protein
VEAAFEEVRALVARHHGVATTLGFGPRYLHSTGQLHKGGAPGGVFLQVTCEESVDLAIPGREFTFGRLKMAQAAGDLQSLEAHGRAARRVHLGANIDEGMAALRQAVRSALEPLPAARR